MARETKVGLIVGLGVILFVSVFVSDYLSVPKHQEALGQEDLSNFVDQTTNQPTFILSRESETAPAAPITDPIELAAASLESIERRQGPPRFNTAEPVTAPPFRQASTDLIGIVDESTPVARNPLSTNPEPVGFNRVDDAQLALGNQLSANRPGPDNGSRNELAHVEIPQLINAQPIKIEHTVAPGETLTAIARKHYDGDGNMWRSIRDANPGKIGTNGEIVQGITLTIPKRSIDSDDPTAQLSDRATGTSQREPKQRVRMITVKDGQTLSELAAEHLGSSGKWQLIMDVNTDVLEKPEHLRAGMKLRIPAEQVVELVEQANEALAQPTPPRDTPQTPNANTNTNTNANATYTVKEGDSLYRIAQKLLGDGDRYKEIYEANRDQLKSASDIRVGMKLKLPAR